MPILCRIITEKQPFSDDFLSLVWENANTGKSGMVGRAVLWETLRRSSSSFMNTIPIEKAHFEWFQNYVLQSTILFFPSSTTPRKGKEKKKEKERKWTGDKKKPEKLVFHEFLDMKISFFSFGFCYSRLGVKKPARKEVLRKRK